MMLSVKDLIPSEESGEPLGVGGYNELPKFMSDNLGVVRPHSSEFGVNTITVFLDDSFLDRRYFNRKTGKNTVTHEGGHFYIFATQPKEYSTYLNKLRKTGRKINGGHNADDPSGQRADEFEDIRFD